MSQKVKHPRKSTEEVETGDFKTPDADKSLENGVAEQKDQKKQSSEQKDQKKQSSEQKDQKKQSSDHKDQKKQSSEHKDTKKGSPDQKDSKKPSSKSPDAKETSKVNGQDKELVNGEAEKSDKRSKRVTRSRSSTPQTRKTEDTVSLDKTIPEETTDEAAKNGTEEGEVNGQTSSETEVSNNGEESTQMSDKVEMDALILGNDEPEPELEFDESSDFSESGKGSPVISRCKTRRSQTRNIPTPKTPKFPDDNESEKSNKKPATPASPPSEHTDSDTDTSKKVTRSRAKKQAADTDDDSMTSDNLSTKAEAGSDSTRLDFMNQDSGLADENSFLSTVKDRSLGETLRGLSPRKSIRQTNVDFRKRVLKGNLDKADFAYFNHNSVDRITTGIKRKNRSVTPDDAKRMKLDNPGFFTRITSPLLNIRNKFRTELPSSTPKLMGYKNKDSFENEHVSKIILYGEEDNSAEKKWCSIM